MLSFFLPINPGRSLDPLLSLMEKGPAPSSRGNPVTYIPGPPERKTGQSAVVGRRVAHALESLKKASALPPDGEEEVAP